MPEEAGLLFSIEMGEGFGQVGEMRQGDRGIGEKTGYYLSQSDQWAVILLGWLRTTDQEVTTPLQTLKALKDRGARREPFLHCLGMKKRLDCHMAQDTAS